MKRLSKFLPHIVLGAGAVALALRIWLFCTGIDDRGLLSTTHPANPLIYILTALTLGVCFLLSRFATGTLPYSKMFKGSIPAGIGCFAGAAGILITDIKEFATATNIIATGSCVLGIGAALCLIIIGICRIKKLRPTYYLHAIVTGYFMFHILSQYQSWNIEPQLQCYFPQLLASVFLMIATYYRTTLDAQGSDRRAFLFFNYGALFFSCLAVTGETPLFYIAMVLWTATSGCSVKPARLAPAMVLPENVQLCISTLEKSGHSAYVVGGCVRDHLLGLTPHDYDLCTDATPDQISRLFEEYTLVKSGEKHGTIGVVIDSTVYEITTFRTEGSYSDNRHPDEVTFVSSIGEDLSRRDFTVNAMAYSPTRGYADPFGGQRDLKAGILRAVGNPETRFREDALRILRGMRFAVRFRLTPEENTLAAMFACAPLMEHLAKERIFAELSGLLPLVSAQDLATYRPILTQVIPELSAIVDFQQNNPHHIYDVYTHTAHAVEAAPQEIGLRLAALLHDIGKPAVYSQDEAGVGHFYGHAQVSAKMAEEILKGLKVSNALREQVVFLVENHMTLFEPDKKILRRRLSKFGFPRTMELMALQKADLIATSTDVSGALAVYDTIAEMITQIREEDSCLRIKDLAINGAMLIDLGMEPGPQIGECLEHLLSLVMEDTIPNEKDALLDAAKAYISA